MFRKLRRAKKKASPNLHTDHSSGEPLNTIPPGTSVKVDHTTLQQPHWLEQLQAYGITAGSHLEVIQQSPVTMIQVEHVKLAFEEDIAKAIYVHKLDTFNK